MNSDNNVVRGAFKDPKTKADVIDRMMSRDFSGDLADLAVDRNLKLLRIKPHVMRMKFGHSGEQFDLTIHKTRPPKSGNAQTVKIAAAKSNPVGRKRGRRRTDRAA